MKMKNEFSILYKKHSGLFGQPNTFLSFLCFFFFFKLTKVINSRFLQDCDFYKIYLFTLIK